MPPTGENTMRLIGFTLALLLASFAPAYAAQVTVAATGPVVEIGVTETVQSAPDLATVAAGVTTRAPTAVVAMQQNAIAADKVIARLRSLGIPRADIQTAGVTLSAQYRYNNDNTPPTFLGYDAANQVNIILRDVGKVGPTLDALVAAGANNISGPSFSVDNDRPIRDAARKAAFARAGSQATDYARMAGYSGVKLLSVEESVSERGPMPVSRNDIIVTASKVQSTPIEPGRVGTALTLIAKYEMTR